MSFLLKHKYSCVFFISFLLFLFLTPRPSFAVVRTWDGGGTDGTCGGSAGDGNKWSCAANWSSDTAPTSADDAVFDGTSTKNATINTSVTVKGLSINAGYTGTITQATGMTVTVGSDSFSQAAGTFSGGDSTFAVSNGSFTLSAGTYTPTSGSFTIEKNLTFSGGTFNMSGKKVVFNGGANQTSTLTCTGSLDGTVGMSKTTTSGSLTLSSGCTINLDTLLDGKSGTPLTNNGTMVVASSITINQITFTNNGTFTHNGTTWVMSKGSYINSSGATTTYAGTALSLDKNFTQNGTFDLTGKTITFTSSAANDLSTLICGSTLAGSIVVNKTISGATFGLSGDCTIAGDFTRTAGVVSNPGSATTLTVQGNFSMSSSDAFGGANLTLVLGGSGTKTLTQNAGTFSSPIQINKTSSGEIDLSTAFTTSSTACTVVAGTFSLGGQNFTCGSTFTVQNGGTLQLQGGETVTTPTLNSGSTVIYNGTAGPYTVNNWSYQALTINGSGGTFNTGSTITVSGNFTLSGGTLTAPSGTLSVAGNFSNTGGTFTHNNGTVNLNGTNQTISGATTFYSLTKSVTSAATLTFPSSTKQTLNGTLTLTGTSGNLLSLRSSTTGTQWQIDPQGARSISYVDVKDSNNTNTNPIVAGTGSVDSGNNTNWSFTGASFANFSLDSPGDNSYTSSERPTFRWRASSNSAISSYKLNVVNGESGDFSVDGISASGTTDIATSKYTVRYENFSDSDSTNNYISIFTKSSSDWNSGENDGKLKEGKRTWKITAHDTSGNDQALERAVFLDTTPPVLDLSKINDTSFSSSKLPTKTFSTYSTKPTISGSLTDLLVGEVGKKAASGPNSVEVEFEKKNAAGGYDPYSINTLNFTDTFFTATNEKISDNAQNTSDKYANFSFIPSDSLVYGRYRVTVSGKDKAGNTGGPAPFILIIGPYSQIVTSEENKFIEKEIEKQFPGATEEEKNKIKEELKIVKPTESKKSSAFQTLASNISAAVFGFFSNVIKTVREVAATTAYSGSKIADSVTQTVRNATTPKKILSKQAPQKKEDPFKDIKEKLQITSEDLYVIWIDKEPTRITDVKILETGKDYAVIYWKTNHYTNNNKVNYGETMSYGNHAFAPDQQKEHKLKLTNLQSGKKYVFEVMSQNKNYVYDSFHEFTTK